MAGLREAAEAVGLDGVSTYIQSGNLVFESNRDASEISTALRSAILERFDIDVPVVLRDAQTFASIARSHPFEPDASDIRHLMVAFLDTEPSIATQEALPVGEFAPDVYRHGGREIYIHYPSGSARSKLTAETIDQRLEVISTMRSWRTVRALAKVSAD